MGTVMALTSHGGYILQTEVLSISKILTRFRQPIWYESSLKIQIKVFPREIFVTKPVN